MSVNAVLQVDCENIRWRYMTQKLQYDIYKIMVLKQGNVIHQTVSNHGAFREKKLFYSKTNVSTGTMKHNIRAYIIYKNINRQQRKSLGSIQKSEIIVFNNANYGEIYNCITASVCFQLVIY